MKSKVRSSIAKRFRITGTGKVLFRGSHIRHLKRHKSKSNLRRQNVPHKLTGALKLKVKKLLNFHES